MNPNDPYFPEQWALEHLNAPAGWACMPPGAPQVIVAFVDSGIAENHADLQARVLPQQTVINILRDDDDHGTMVAGTTGAVTDNGIGIAGAAPVKILSVKFCSGQIWPEPKFGEIAIRAAANFTHEGKPTRVIVLAWDVGYTTSGLGGAIEEARAKDVVIVIAAGNHALNNDRSKNWPANHHHPVPNMDNVITVMATQRLRVLSMSAPGGPALQVIDERASFSNYGATTVDIGAPAIDVFGEGSLTTTPYFGAGISTATPHYRAGLHERVGYRKLAGTSASAAFVGGLAALIRAQNPTWSAPQVKSHLLTTARAAPGLNGVCAIAGVADYRRALCPPGGSGGGD